ncbi:hypothetical protein J5J01_21600 [Streptomyces fradiae]|uniref:hypothetical protein n=1 Tax=Streptomyces fradiae TaxID=1906 RepID=UPI002019E6B8|nr:hypothetical protein [Streptomyces fradiae]UQS29509.1 hypothetical protein J5J01_21600 [Streptomyces fradiae]
MTSSPGDEPVFVRTGGHWHYNHRNRVGRVLIVVTGLMVAWGLYDYADDIRWSEAELRAAVHEAERAVESEPLPAYQFTTGYGLHLRDAVHASGEGPEHGARVEAREEGGGADRYEVTTTDTDTAYCVSVTPSVRDLPRDVHGRPSGDEVRPSLEVAEGPC